jgi:hypothetical protein
MSPRRGCDMCSDGPSIIGWGFDVTREFESEIDTRSTPKKLNADVMIAREYNNQEQTSLQQQPPL